MVSELSGSTIAQVACGDLFIAVRTGRKIFCFLCIFVSSFDTLTIIYVCSDLVSFIWNAWGLNFNLQLFKLKDKLWFSCEIFFSSFWLVLTKFSFCHKGWVLVYYSSKFWGFPDFSLSSKNLSLKSFGNSWCNSYTSFLLLIIVLRFTCGERKIW